MKKFIWVLCAMGFSFQLFGQNAISGHLDDHELKHWDTKVHLKELALEATVGKSIGKPIAVTRLKKDGSFSFHKKYISESNKLYRISVNRVHKALGDTLVHEADFILSNKDFIRFGKGPTPLASYETSNTAQLEWQKLKNFESNLLTEFIHTEERIAPSKAYVKDSLQILMVKLIGVKQLESKALLDQDIAQNESYYLALLTDLKQSDLEPSQYLFLEKKLAYLTGKSLESQLLWSKWVISFLIILTIGLGFALLRSRKFKKNRAVSLLSKQENTIRTLILQGMSNKEIANELYISLSTVKSHITSIYSKLNVSNRQELVQKDTGAST
ncbi:response regulator transcription factor [Flagellimonas flava]|nr:LuxR C-terminal-related transcriptional regulator [Allomuricauda flava]